MLASRSFAKTVNTSFFRLPPHLRVSIWQQSTKRPFSASTAQQSSLVDAAVAPPIALLDSLHAIGLPWHAVLPVTAILARGVFGYYFATLPSRRRAGIRSDLAPLVAASVNLKARQNEAVGRFRGKRDAAVLKRQDAMMTRFRTMFSLSRKFKAGPFRPSAFVNFGVLIAFTEAVRLKSGAHDGLLSILVTPFQWLASKISPTRFPPAPDLVMEERVRQLEQMRAQAMRNGEWPQEQIAAVAPQVQTAPVLDKSSLFFDQTLQTEGFSWCPDLTLADPTGYIPSVLLLIVAGQVLFHPLRKERRFPFKYSPLQNLQLIISGLFYMVALQLPAGVTLYLASTMAVGAVQRRWLDVTAPIRAPIMPCKKPTRVKVRKEWDDMR